jgi:hypothetical protein
VTDPGRSDAELARLDVGALLAQGIRDGEGHLRGELAGEGAVAAAIRLEDHMVTAEQAAATVAVLAGERPPLDLPPPPALSQLVDQGLAACRDDGDKLALLGWLRRVAELMAMRRRSP